MGLLSILLLFLIGNAASQWRPAIVEGSGSYGSGNSAAVRSGFRSAIPAMRRVIADVTL